MSFHSLLPVALAAAVAGALAAPAVATPAVAAPTAAAPARTTTYSSYVYRHSGDGAPQMLAQLAPEPPRSGAYPRGAMPPPMPFGPVLISDNQRRPQLGVILAPDARSGVSILAVTPGSAAARAGLHSGDRLRGQIVGNTLTAWVDKGGGWMLIGSASDTSGTGGGAAFTSGTPGIGFFKTSGSGPMDQFGFTDFRVTELP